MARVMTLVWDGITPAQYDALRPLVGWEAEVPEGLRLHVAWFTDEGISVVDVWDAEEQWERFAQDRLLPGLQQVGAEGEPDVEWHDAHDVFQVPRTPG